MESYLLTARTLEMENLLPGKVSSMDLYVALQAILDKVQETTNIAKYSQDDKEMVRAILDNQTRLAEGVLILGGLMKAILADDIEVQIMAGKNDTKH